MAAQGWVPVNRQLQEHWLWKDKPFSKGQAWIDLIMLANHEDKKMPYKGKVITCERGTVNLSISFLADRWGWSRHKARDFFKLLEADGMVTVNATTNRTTITIENYALHNDSPTTKGQRKDSEGTAEGQRGDTTNNDNNYNNDNKNIYIEPPELNDAVLSFIEFRKKIKKPMTDRAVQLLIGKLKKLSSNTAEQIEILEQSIMNGWTSIYPLKGEEKKGDKGNAGFKELDTKPTMGVVL